MFFLVVIKETSKHIINKIKDSFCYRKAYKCGGHINRAKFDR